ncbi:TetR/AcrR family transcriptional regulator [Aeromicrobium tamlense]|uniref:AcrR family transcriptional regulator n=1 Tax=Aeromicrobium tamlense TaxID=375541 RepID=A0A8I0KLC4_9ACTN|nr:MULTISPECIES: TetR/AcrR family transcriptional regulator [Aeromicrobium]MBD1269918.1 TetR/AcrR family transcriptional regulator [Aeromicrobium tamlense]NYI39425.1 AcrR family transcriptional regulator [Aeromicrobium tamlense]
MTESPTRTPQPERTRLMRQRLLEATIDSLVEVGWAGTSTTVVSQRAGVSRGAQLHHFPSKQDLVVAAVEYLAERRREELAVDIDALPEEGRTRAVLDLLVSQYTSPVFLAALELWVAARTDSDLLAKVAPFERRVGREIHAHAVTLLEVDESRGRNRQLVQATLDLLRGLGLAATLTDDSARRASILDAWADTLDRELER